MSKAKWGVGVSFFFGIIANVAPIPSGWKVAITIFCGVGLAVSLIGWLLTKDKALTAGFNASAGRDISGTIAGRDVHQNIYHGIAHDVGASQTVSLITFLITADPTCYSRNTWAIGPVRFLHAKVSISRGSVLCSAYLTKVTKGDEVKWEHGPEQLTFSNHTLGDPLPRKLHHGLSYNLDVLVIVCEGSEIRVCNDEREWQRRPRLREIFADKGDYVLTIKLAGDGAETKTIDIQFNWTGYWQTSFLTLPNEEQANTERSVKLISSIESRIRQISDLLEEDSKHLDAIASYPPEFQHKATQQANFSDLFEVEKELIEESLALYKKAGWSAFCDLWQSSLALNREIRAYNQTKTARTKNDILKWTVQIIPKNLVDATIQSAKPPS